MYLDRIAGFELPSGNARQGEWFVATGRLIALANGHFREEGRGRKALAGGIGVIRIVTPTEETYTGRDGVERQRTTELFYDLQGFIDAMVVESARMAIKKADAQSELYGFDARVEEPEAPKARKRGRKAPNTK